LRFLFIQVTSDWINFGIFVAEINPKQSKSLSDYKSAS